MDRGVIQVYYGEGHGKSTAAIGNAIRIASEGKSVIIIQFLKGKNENELTFLSRLEPEIKIFRFAKSDECFEALSESGGAFPDTPCGVCRSVRGALSCG